MFLSIEGLGIALGGHANVSFVSANESLFLLKGHARKYFIKKFKNFIF